MKRFLAILVVLAIPASVFAYELTDPDKILVDRVVQKIDNISKKSQDKIIHQLTNAYEKAKSGRMKSLVDSVIKKFVSKGEYRVIQAVDGDTIKVDFHGKPMNFRILGLDTPEKFTTRTGFEECYGKEASAFAEKTLSGQIVKLETGDSEDLQDRYGRMLANVWVGTGLYQTLVIREGYGFRYVYNNSPTKYDSDLKIAEETAQKNNLGVWKYCNGKRVPVKDSLSSVKSSTGMIIPATTSIIIPTLVTVPAVSPVITGGKFSCSAKKLYCTQMTSCEEAKFYLNSCNIGSLDKDKDGIPCESLCK